jgi:hypothetical protein
MTLNYLPAYYSHGLRVFNVTTSTSKEAVPTSTTAENGVQADSQQLLTKPANTALYVTPTMTFGEVGHVSEQETGGYAARAHGVGEFTQTDILERMVKLGEFDWTVDDNTATLYFGDIDGALRAYPRNKDVLDLFHFYRTDIEVTVKLNTNQFYYGALMVTMWPGNNTGTYRWERAVLDPTVISASSAESVVKTWSWSWPYPWRGLAGPDANGTTSHPVWLCIDSLCKLEAAKDGMPTSVNVQLWGRFKNIKLAYPYGPAEAPREKASHRYKSGAPYLPHPSIQAQSGVKVAYPKKGATTHPAQDGGVSKEDNPITQVVDAVTSVPATIIDGLLGAAGSVVDNGMSALLGSFLDKPDQVDGQTPVIIEQSKDMYASDIPDSNVCFSLSKSRYVDPSPDRMPLTKPWTLLDYAKIPGILWQSELSASNPNDYFYVIQNTTLSDQTRTPLDYATKCCMLWRGSVKLMIQFFCSSFVSARVVIQLRKDDSTFDADYDYGLAKVINVKGDTVDYVTIPWLNYAWWGVQEDREIKISLASDIASPETTGLPRIQYVVWAAAADDFQFQFPRVPTATEWPAPAPAEAQAAIGKMFEAEFPPIADNVFYDTDEGFSTAETIEGMCDVAKRYSPLNEPDGDTNFSPLTFDYNMIDKDDQSYSNSIGYAQYVAQRNSLFGAMRACFMFRSGGYRVRAFPLVSGHRIWRIINSLGTQLNGTIYCQPFDEVARMTVPQVSIRPFIMLNDAVTDWDGATPAYGLTLAAEVLSAPFLMLFLAARDDIQLGYPILPKGVPIRYSPAKGSKKVLAQTKRSGETRVLG